MKTTKIISALSLALILATANTVFSNIPEKPSARDERVKTVMFRVNVHIATEQALSGVYQVQLVYGNGSLVAPPQTYIPGVNSYLFAKVLNTSWYWSSVVTARLVKVSSHGPSSPPELFTRPDTKIVNFVPGRMYMFNLYPMMIIQKRAIPNDAAN